MISVDANQIPLPVIESLGPKLYFLLMDHIISQSPLLKSFKCFELVLDKNDSDF